MAHASADPRSQPLSRAATDILNRTGLLRRLYTQEASTVWVGHPLARTEVPGWVEPSVKPFRTTSPLPRGGGTGDFFILASIVGFAAAAAAAAPVPDPDAGGAPPAKKQRRSKLEVARTKHEAAIVKLAELQQKASATRHAANKTRLGPKKDELSLKADTAEQQVAAQKQLADALAAEVDGRS
jgi:pyruvate/2-oxoglutarate dehydrogenase complex dihydrolipoamide acyltransferase (E2) component